jgi:hypothetical protein
VLKHKCLPRASGGTFSSKKRWISAGPRYVRPIASNVASVACSAARSAKRRSSRYWQYAPMRLRTAPSSVRTITAPPGGWVAGLQAQWILLVVANYGVVDRTLTHRGRHDAATQSIGDAGGRWQPRDWSWTAGASW